MIGIVLRYKNHHKQTKEHSINLNIENGDINNGVTRCYDVLDMLAENWYVKNHYRVQLSGNNPTLKVRLVYVLRKAGSEEDCFIDNFYIGASNLIGKFFIFYIDSYFEIAV